MKIIRIIVDGLPLYKDSVEISFLASQRIEKKHMESIINLYGNIYVNAAEAFVGINASGKSIALKLISFVNKLLEALPLNSEKTDLNAELIPNLIDSDQPITFDIVFFADNKYYRLNTQIVNKFPDEIDKHRKLVITSEALWEKKATKNINKANLFNFDGLKPIRIRSQSSEYLPDDVSIMIALNKQLKDKMTFIDLGLFTNFNIYFPKSSLVPTEIIELLDPTIESISIEKRQKIIKLKFKHKNEIILYDPAELYGYLSSGTIKGLMVFDEAVTILRTGGYLVIDEIENHFNRELVAELIKLFMDKRTNTKGAVIIFSTHYPELLDLIERNDSIFITKNNGSLSIQNLNSLLKRNDLKKSEVFQSNYLGGTAPKYSSIFAFHNSIVKSQEDDKS